MRIQESAYAREERARAREVPGNAIGSAANFDPPASNGQPCTNGRPPPPPADRSNGAGHTSGRRAPRGPGTR
ncbi:hypothetical protein GCM10009863_43320 [Streptomyces axinellae]|uniref:Uncharacterized protein n=1 Tax=Streptomyces axinellae TaxID=552788 RepID=A0ABP6CPN8_9ACTN